MVSIWYSLVFIGFNMVFHMFFIWFSFVFMGVHVVFIWFSFVFIGFHVVFGFHILQNRFQDTNSMPAHFAVPSATFTSVAVNAMTQGCLGQCNNFMVTAQERSKEGPYGAIRLHMVFICFHMVSIGLHMWFSYGFHRISYGFHLFSYGFHPPPTHTQLSTHTHRALGRGRRPGGFKANPKTIRIPEKHFPLHFLCSKSIFGSQRNNTYKSIKTSQLFCGGKNLRIVWGGLGAEKHQEHNPS